MSAVTAPMTTAALNELAIKVLEAAGVTPRNAASVARALVRAECDGLPSHGMARLPAYAGQAASGKVDGSAVPVVSTPASASVLVDAKCGYAYPAIDAGLPVAIERAREHGTVGLAIANSHHAGVAGHPVEDAAADGLLALGFSNTPGAIAPWGGTKASYGTNPIAFACPRDGQPPLVVDLSLSQVARGKIQLAAQRGDAIPDDWAFDASGAPTTDASDAMQGTMAPLGGSKGAALALCVELLTAALTASHFAYEASSFFETEGPAPRTAQSFLLIDPAKFAGAAFAARVEDLLSQVLEQEGTRLPGARRLQAREAVERDGVTLPAKLHEQLLALI